jgi:hypothetical protein
LVRRICSAIVGGSPPTAELLDDEHALMDQANWVPEEVPLDRPNVARMWDYFLGGAHNFAVDREAAEQAIKLYPDVRLVAQANRAFLRRAVQFLTASGITQFLDIGSGIPTAGSVHEVAQRAHPDVRVVYVDIDPVAVAHSRAILQDVPTASAIQADARQPEELLTHPEVRRMLDWTRPIGVFLLALLHFVPDDAEAMRIVRTLQEAMPSGSYLVITHGTTEQLEEAGAQVEQLYRGATSPIHFRTREQITRFFEGFELVEPGLVYVPLWRPESEDDLLLDNPHRSNGYAGVGRKP